MAYKLTRTIKRESGRPRMVPAEVIYRGDLCAPRLFSSLAIGIDDDAGTKDDLIVVTNMDRDIRIVPIGLDVICQVGERMSGLNFCGLQIRQLEPFLVKAQSGSVADVKIKAGHRGLLKGLKLFFHRAVFNASIEG